MHFRLPLLLIGAATLTAAIPTPINDNKLLTKRDADDVVAAVQKISDQTLTLNSSVASYPGGIEGTLDAIKIETEAIGLNFASRKAVHTAQRSSNFTSDGSLNVAGAFLDLLPIVTSTLDNIIDKKPEFDTGLLEIGSLSFLVKYNLETEKRLSLKLGDVVQAKLTPEYASIAPLVLGQIEDAFTEAISVYSS